MAKRLWTMAIFTVLLSLALITTTRAGMAGIIAATATQVKLDTRRDLDVDTWIDMLLFKSYL
jgi:hypothetical protein